MRIEYKSNGVYVTDTKDFNIKRSCECGQCFRFDEDGQGYTGVVGSNIIKMRPLADGCFFEGVDEKTFKEIYIPYFDLERDYESIYRSLCENDTVMQRAADYGRGVRLFKQDIFECLISFIISQNNNIPRIKGIITRLCSLLGKELKNGLYTFPTPEAILNADIEGLAPIRAGFRAKYIIDACEKVVSRKIDLQHLEKATYQEAMESLMQIKGVGEKVANCVLLFGAGHIEAFPKDVWIKRALNILYPENPNRDFGQYGGIAQQYLFVYTRENKLI